MCLFISWQQVSQKMRKNRSEILLELNRLSSEKKFLEILLLLCNKNLNSRSDELATRNLNSLLNENEISFLFGLWLKNKHFQANNENDILLTAIKIHTLMDEFHYTFIEFFPKFDSINSYHSQFKNNSEAIKETIFYSASGAYDYQFMNFLELKYGCDDAWLEENKGFNSNDAKKLFLYIKATLNYKLNLKQYKSEFELYSFSFDNYVFKKFPRFKVILDHLTFSEYNIDLNFNDIGDFNKFKIQPVIKTKNAYIIPLSYLLAEAIYDSPFFWMNEDKKYSQKALLNRGNSAEAIVKSILEKKIYSNKIFSSVLIKKNKATSITDIDICILHDKKMLLFQIKSKRLTQLSKNGNIEKFQKDFKQAVQDANFQSVKSKEAIFSGKCEYILKSTGEKIDFGQIDEIYTACIVLDSYPSITAHTRLFFSDEETIPVAMSIFDLEVIIEFIRDFDHFFDYLKKRTLYSKDIMADNELSYFSHYLKNDLKKVNNSDKLILNNDFAQRFDYDYYFPLLKKYESKYEEFIIDIDSDDFCFCGSGINIEDCCNK